MTVVAAHPQWIVPDWAAPRNVRTLITTRAGGVSGGPFAAGTGGGMNIGLKSGDVIENVRSNRARLRAVLPNEPCWLQQVHGATVVRADAASAPATADAAISLQPGCVCAVSIADCLPVLFADRRGRAVGAAHAGWRGLARGVLVATVAALGELDADAGDLAAWLGPAIGPRAFEVGRDVLDAFAAADRGSDAFFVPTDDGKWLADLYALARRQLAAAGVGEVHGGSHCTVAEAARFFSHRRDKAAGRMASLVWITRSDAPATL